MGGEAARRGPPIIAVELLLFGLWAVSAPWLGRLLGLDITTTALAEVVDHVIPGVAVLAVAATAITTGRRPLAASLVVTACGVWMTATHVPLLRQAATGEAGLAASLWHAIPGFVILLLGAAAAVTDAGSRSAAAGRMLATGQPSRVGGAPTQGRTSHDPGGPDHEGTTR